MRRVNQLGSLVVLAVALYVIKESLGLDYMSSLGPGPGFFPLWLGIALGALAVSWFVQEAMRPDEPIAEGFVPDRNATVRILSIIGSLVVLCFALEPLGFQITTFIFLLFLLINLGRVNLAATLAISALGSFGTYYLFKTWLEVPLPTTSIPFLAPFGL